MKKISKLAVVLLMLMLFAFAGVACSGVKEISIEEVDMPQTVYLLGSDLNLAGGTLTVSYKNKTDTVALDSSKVSVTGYDKNKLGEQPLTIKYQGKTTALTVKVVNQVEAENIESTYFVGESLDISKGRLRVTEEDGTSTTVALSYNRVTLTGFSAATAGKCTVTASYAISSTRTVTGTFTVNVYELESATLTKPEQLSYQSHETAFKVSGGTVNLVGSSGSETVLKKVPLSTAMFSGSFDLSAATYANARTTPFSQTVSVDYIGFHDTFTITISFSDVSVVKYRAGQIANANLSWTGDSVPTINPTLGGYAKDAAELYLNLTDAEKELITDAEKTHVARTAAAYGYSVWSSAAKGFSEIFTINYGISLTCESYEIVVSNLEKLTTTNSTLYETLHQTVYPMGDLLIALRDDGEFDELVLYGSSSSSNVYLTSYLAYVYGSEGILGDLVPVLQLMVDLHETFNIPLDFTDWEAADLNGYATDIEDTRLLIVGSPVNLYRSIFTIVSSWRDNKDMFDIIYTYYYSKNNSAGIAAMQSLQNIYLPGLLEELHSNIINGLYCMWDMEDGYAIDSTEFMLYYRTAMNKVDEIMEGDNEMYQYLYYKLEFDFGQTYTVYFDTLLWWIKGSSFGYLDNTYLLLGDPTYMAFLDDYLDVVEAFYTDENYDIGKGTFNDDIEALFKEFVEMSPVWQLCFLMSTNVYYTSFAQNLYFTLDINNSLIAFTDLMGYYYGEQLEALDEDAYWAFYFLMLAVEDYAMYQFGYSDASYFEYFMEYAIDFYDGLFANTKAAFDDLLGFCYDRYLGIYNRHINNYQQIDISDYEEWEDKFDELADSLYDLYGAIYYYNGGANNLDSMIISTYLVVEQLMQEIVTTAPAVVVNAFYYNDYPFYSDASMPLPYIIFSYRTYYTSFLREIMISYNNETISYVLWDFYTPKLQSFLIDANHTIFQGFYQSDSYDNAAVLKALKSYRELGLDEQMAFQLGMEKDVRLYYRGLWYFMEEFFTDTASQNVGKQLAQVEYLYSVYQSCLKYSTATDAATYKSYLKTSYTSLQSYVTTLGSAGVTELDTALEGMYTYYNDICSALWS